MIRTQAYPGQGKSLEAVAAATGNVKTGSTTIAHNGYSEWVSMADCKELQFIITFLTTETSQTGRNVIIHRADNPLAATYEVESTTDLANVINKTLAVSGNNGFFRLANTATRSLSVKVQKRLI